ncbi:PREDICTED: uncharacterized protein LOC104753844 [Camelina sativa]|uniref:Uncharacterized protein LOC104753844 n=1 Tax=Camelina sativa TaxID=90675 RepID=A0ABM0WPS4_CAMSA|nr:PREDICTED: uncharacterized protein LOC104753844 [Camelina sativa]
MGIPMIVSQWTPFAEEAQPAIKSIPLWVTLTNIPPTMFTKKGIKFLASAVGKPRTLNPKTEACVSFGEAQILIEADLTKPLPKVYTFTGEEEGELDWEVNYAYPWLPPRCSECQKWGHLQDSCLAGGTHIAAPTLVQVAVDEQETRSPLPVVPQVVQQPLVATVTERDPSASQTVDIHKPISDETQGWTTPKSGRSLPRSQEKQKVDVVSPLKNAYSVLATKEATGQEDLGDDTQSDDVGDEPAAHDCILANVSKRRGRIWVIWKDTVRMTPFYKSEQVITCSVKLPDREEEFFASFVYASNSVEDRKKLWKHSRTEDSSMVTSGMRDFQEVVNYCSFADMGSHIPLYTWCNKRANDLILKKLDRVMVNEAWNRCYPQSYSVFEAGGCSDHLHCRIHLSAAVNTRVRGCQPFKFVNALSMMEAFKPTVHTYWTDTEPISLSTSSLFRFAKKLKGLKPRLKALAKDRLGDLVRRTREAYDTLCHKQLANQTHPSQLAMEEEHTAYERWDRLAVTE